jgi:hypothetical protein
MPKNGQDMDKLIPLRRFVVPGLYELPYLSLLVQRKKLRAEKIGSKYFTTRKWFDDYLENHAQERKRDAYLAVESAINEKTRTAISREIVSTVPDIKKAKNYLPLRLKAALFGSAVFLLLIFSSWYYFQVRQDKGQAAGVEETNFASSTIEVEQGK